MKHTGMTSRDWFYVFILCLWPVTVLAAGQSLGATFGLITTADWLTLVLLALFSGLVALLQRMRKSFYYEALLADGREGNVEDHVNIDWRIFALCHMTGAIFVGFLSFLFCEAFEGFNTYMEAASIALMAYSGAKVADKWADGLNDSVMARINAFVNGGSKGNSP